MPTLGAGDVAELEREASGDAEGGAVRSLGPSIRELEQLLEPPEPFALPLTTDPQRLERLRQPEPKLRFGSFDAIPKRSSKIVEVQHEALEPFRLPRATRERPRGLGESQEVRRVAAAKLLAGRVDLESLGREFPHGLEHRIANRASRRCGSNQALVDE